MLAEKLIVRDCPSCSTCNRGQVPFKYSEGPWVIKECANCRFVYLENVPVYAALQVELAWESTSETEREKKQVSEPVRQFFSSQIKFLRKEVLKRDKLSALIGQYFHAGNVLDIGCASADMLSRLDERFIPFGVEISEFLAAEGNRRLKSRGGGVVQANAVLGTSSFESNFFTGIIMSAFLEHEASPAALLKESFRVLAVGGKAIIKVPNYNCIARVARGKKWCGFRYPDHVNYFSPGNLRSMCESAGFSIEQFTLADRYFLSDNMWIVLGKR
ncbi:MAG: class I SAM-dependent methyltransferase [Pseudomonadales bacterium]|nr:class I SAM-dependent methyltransferase [Pseudomonadales bacterium]MDP4911625.1 class I SAM-dependent methyltransferase [Pseudomonadales bacterium]MDP5059156.1 class I SAM-dependent methyltransferase [Pseudomonadales bacterium]